jgi:hypothetical protein
VNKSGPVPAPDSVHAVFRVLMTDDPGVRASISLSFLVRDSHVVYYPDAKPVLTGRFFLLK